MTTTGNSSRPAYDVRKTQIPSGADSAFARLVWKPDRMLMDDLVFRLVHTQSEDWNGPEHFMFFKMQGLVDEYRDFFAGRSAFTPRNFFELGIFDGGSAAFWHEIFHPRKLVAVDILERDDSPYFQKYVTSRGLSQAITTHWGVDQADKGRLAAIASSEFSGPIDLVIDDCSHLCAPTLASFEALFPFVRPGGLYIIEDWGWAYLPEFNDPRHPWAFEKPLTELVKMLVEVAGNPEGLIKSVTACRGFAAVERGEAPIPVPKAFRLRAFEVKRGIRAGTLRLRHLPAILMAWLRHMGQTALPAGSNSRRLYRAAKRTLRSKGFARTGNSTPRPR